MCCWTHKERDSNDDMHFVEYTRADSEHFRCVCGYGQRCDRQQDGPDLLCEWCRGRNHDRECVEIDQRQRDTWSIWRARQLAGYPSVSGVIYDEPGST